jgi:hypothetical protein
MLDALVTGETDPNVLADLTRRQMRMKHEDPRRARGARRTLDWHHGLWVGVTLRHIDFVDEQSEQLTG